jgi:signal transduction histidine kinase
MVSPSGHIDHVDEIQNLIEQAIHYTRSLTFELSPPVLYDLGFDAAVEWLVEQIQDQHHIQVDLEDDRQSKPMSDEIRISLFKAVRELLINIAKHAKAHKAKVSTRREDNTLRIIVEDDGVGFSLPEDKLLGKIAGYGLFSIRERLKHLGGSFEIESNLGCGTRVTLVAPLEQANNKGGIT